jgi:SAM-dependent methyltransferase
MEPGADDSDLELNRALWTVINGQYSDGRGEAAWSEPEITWGLFNVPEAEVQALGDVAGRDVLELGCGTAYFSGWLARRGARAVALDATRAQLRTAHRCRTHFGLDVALVEGNGERVPLRDASFDIVFSEYGASLWCDPDLFIAEAARLLRPGGRLVFLTNSVLSCLCVPDEEGPAGTTLLREQRPLRRVLWPGGGVEFHPGHGEVIAILRTNGFRVEALHELYAPADATLHKYYDIATPEWAQQWPVEDLWVAYRE